MSVEDILFDEHGCNAAGARRYTISFRPNGSSDPTVYYGKGISTVAYAAGSIIKFTMTDGGWVRMLAYAFGLQTAAGGAGSGFTIEVDTTNTNLDTGVLAVRLINAAGSAADIASDANTMAFLTFTLSKEYGDS